MAVSNIYQDTKKIVHSMSQEEKRKARMSALFATTNFLGNILRELTVIVLGTVIAERDLRMIKVKTKVSGCFRSEEGAQEYLTIMSYIGTGHKHGINAFTAIREAISGNPDIIFD